MLHINAKPIDLKLSVPFRISRGVQQVASNAIVQVNHKEYTGYGEAAPDEYYGENVETVLACITTFAGNLGDDPFVIDDIMRHLDKIIRLHPSAKAAVDMALYDLVGKMLIVPLYKLLGLNPKQTPYTSFTIGIDTPDVIRKKVAKAEQYPVLKMKVGVADDKANMQALREVAHCENRVLKVPLLVDVRHVEDFVNTLARPVSGSH